MVNKLKSKFNITSSFFIGADFYIDDGFSWKWFDGDPIEKTAWWNEDGVNEQPLLPIWKGFKNNVHFRLKFYWDVPLLIGIIVVRFMTNIAIIFSPHNKFHCNHIWSLS